MRIRRGENGPKAMGETKASVFLRALPCGALMPRSKLAARLSTSTLFKPVIAANTGVGQSSTAGVGRSATRSTAGGRLASGISGHRSDLDLNEAVRIRNLGFRSSTWCRRGHSIFDFSKRGHARQIDR